MSESTQLEVIENAYGPAAQVIAEAFTDAHVTSGTLEDTRARFVSLPVATDDATWEEALVERRDGVPDGAGSPLKLDIASGGNEFQVWIDPNSQRNVTLDQLVLTALYHRLHWPADAASLRLTADREERIAARRSERSRLLGLVNPEWGGPLGRLAITEAAPFDDVDSHDALMTAHAGIVDRVADAIGAAVTRARVGAALEPEWTLDPQDFIFNGGSKQYLVGAFSGDSWQFGHEWPERNGTYGHPISAERLLLCRDKLAALADTSGIALDALLAAADPTWHAGYKPTSMWDRSLRLF